jgi:hypothetical protein
LQNKDISERYTKVEKFSIIETVAKILKSDVKKIEEDKETYDVFETISSSKEAFSYVPVSLQIFLSNLFLAKRSEN